MKRAFSVFVSMMLLVAAIYATTQIVSVLGGRKQQDFKTYYYAVCVDRQGMNPYDLGAIQQACGDKDHRWPFVYPPHCLKVLSVFALTNYTVSYYLFFGAKLAALIGLIVVWLKIVPAPKHDYWALAVTMALGCRSAVLRDLTNGNVSSFEQLVLWSGVLALLHGRSIVGGGAILLSSVCKLMPAALVILVVAVRRSWRGFAVAAGLAACGMAGYTCLYASQATGWHQFAAAAGSLDERGGRNPSSLALFRDLCEFAGLGTQIAHLLYGVVCALLLSLWVWAIQRTRSVRDCFPMMYITIAVYVLMVPRMKDYSLIIILLPALHTFSALVHRRWLAVVACILLWVPVFGYQGWVCTALMLGLLLDWVRRTGGEVGENMALTLNPLRVFMESPSGADAKA
jgi:hypothetical protein